MAVDVFLKIEEVEVKGEAQDDKHKDEIDILAWSWGCSQSGTTHMGSGSGAGKVSVQDLSVTKYIDSSSAGLKQSCFTGRHHGKATLTVRKAGENPLEYIILVMKDVIVTSVSEGGSGGEDRLTENVALNFGACDYKYVSQTPDGGAGPDFQFIYDIAANKMG